MHPSVWRLPSLVAIFTLLWRKRDSLTGLVVLDEAQSCGIKERATRARSATGGPGRRCHTRRPDPGRFGRSRAQTPSVVRVPYPTDAAVCTTWPARRPHAARLRFPIARYDRSSRGPAARPSDCARNPPDRRGTRLARRYPRSARCQPVCVVGGRSGGQSSPRGAKAFGASPRRRPSLVSRLLTFSSPVSHLYFADRRTRPPPPCSDPRRSSSTPRWPRQGGLRRRSATPSGHA